MFDPLSKAGALIRRLQQVSIRVFAEETAPFDLTTVQFGALQVIVDHPGIDQVSLSQATDTDRTSIMRILDRLQMRGLVLKRPNSEDRRSNCLYATVDGMHLVAAMSPLADLSQEKLLAPLSAAERESFMQMLTHLVLSHEDGQDGSRQDRDETQSRPLPESNRHRTETLATHRESSGISP